MYKKYGDEWEKEVMKNPKKVIVEMLRRVAIERDGLAAVEHRVQADALEYCENNHHYIKGDDPAICSCGKPVRR